MCLRVNCAAQHLIDESPTSRSRRRRIMRRTLLVGTCLTITLTISGCQDSATAPTAARVAPAASRVLQSELNADTVLDLAELQLPSSARIADQDVINPRDYVCPA